MKSWRDVARPIVAKAIREGRANGLEDKELRKWVHRSYPFGERAMHPYKIWLDEVRRQLDRSRPQTEDLSDYWVNLAYKAREGSDGTDHRQ
jgi:hypothetical protein